MWFLWVLCGLVLWLVAGLVLGTVMGRAVRLADSRTPGARDGAVLTTADLPGGAARAGVAAAAPRRRVPFPPVAVALAAVGVALEGVGYAVALTGARGRLAGLLSMDAPFSVPRLYVAALFAAAAVAALVGGARLSGRRTWWTAVALVAGGVATVKIGSTVHARLFGTAQDVLTTAGAVLASVGIAGAVLAWLWSMSRGDRRDRRRVLRSLGLYAGASVGLSGVSVVVGGVYGGASRWAAMATFVEETGEALTAAAFLVAVLVGVAPRLVLPADWALRRADDARTLDVAHAGAGLGVHREPTG
ncbi:hypothetical protein SAMN05660464_2172 [Geodermatophilus dictyosporus]|uniref:Uncharacterized protein n=1 Tax=Geodermatophilus dictyosporus TaxID=1523247 RepID=A0A1I5MVI5_9ACTN|nr:hypothetical protein [Geodermatophilus dictyosporus]SFP13569.1 hypothetical protein SAMN05660464_2172 [Geodermatophilus dictyosporus]